MVTDHSFVQVLTLLTVSKLSSLAPSYVLFIIRC